MPSSRILISSQTLGSAAASVTFSSIPATFTDLVLRVSVRTNNANFYDSDRVYFNGSSGTTNYSYIWLRGLGSGTPSSGSQTSGNAGTGLHNVGDTATASTFSSGEIYIPNYAGSASKPFSFANFGENNATTARLGVTANLFSSSAAISSITFIPLEGTSYLAGSSFYLYGLRSS
jgi:hypothetical protein